MNDKEIIHFFVDNHPGRLLVSLYFIRILKVKPHTCAVFIIIIKFIRNINSGIPPLLKIF